MLSAVVAATVIIAALGPLTAGCAAVQGHALGVPATGITAGVTESGSSALLTETHRELSFMQTSRYQHRTVVDEQEGSFDFDCSGFLDYALGRALPADLAVLPTSTSQRPLAADIEQHLASIGEDGSVTDPWHVVATVADLAPGDVVAWLATENSTTGDTGHVMIVTGRPVRDPGRSGQWLVSVADSTLSPHAQDSRRNGATGLGTGTIGLAVDDRGRPVAFAWRGGISTRLQTTPIALGRPT